MIARQCQDMTSFQLIAVWNNLAGAAVLVTKNTIKIFFCLFSKLYVMCRRNSASSLELGTFLCA